MSAWPPLVRIMTLVALCGAVAAGLVLGGDGSPKYAVLLVLVAGFTTALLWFPGRKKRFWLALLGFLAPLDLSKALIPPLGQFYSPGLYLTVGEAIVVVLGLWWTIDRLLVQRRAMPVTRLDKLAFAFLLLVWFGAMHSPAGALAYWSAASYSLCVLGFYVVSHTIETKDDLRLFLRLALVSFLLHAMYACAQFATHSFLTLPGAKPEAGTPGLAIVLAEEGSTFRPNGVFEHPNALADYLTLLMPPALALLLLGAQRVSRKIWFTAVAVLGIATVLLLMTLSRGGWLAALLGAAFLGFVYWRRRLIGMGHLMLVAGVAAAGLAAILAFFPQIIDRVTGPDQRSTESRIVLADQAVTIIKAHPLLGVGFGDYNRAASEYIPPAFALISEDYQKELLTLVVHNHYLLLAAELGLPSMFFFVYLMFRFIGQAWPMWQWRDPGMFALGVGFSAALVSQLLFLASDNYYADIRMFLLWLTAGLLQALTLQSRTAVFAAAYQAHVAAATPPPATGTELSMNSEAAA